jgi:hypothetical protein
MQIRFYAPIALLALTACSDPVPEAVSETDQAESAPANTPSPDVVISAEAALIDAFGLNDADHLIRFGDREVRDNLSVPDNFGLTYDDDGGIGRIIIRGTREAPAPHGRTQGVSLELPDDLEQTLAGHRIAVTLIARSNSDTPTIRAAYSTNDVGNSGWRDLSLTPEYMAVSFNFNVPPADRGQGEYLGMLPPATGEAEIAFVAISIVD